MDEPETRTAASRPPSAMPEPDECLGEYRLVRVLGSGGMGVVYLARHESLERPAAVKVIAPHLASDPVFHGRFQRESRLAASLDHPNVVPIYEAGERDGRLFLAMRYVDGTDLRSLIQAEGRLPLRRVLRIVRGIADALDTAHDRELVHRDVKPGNVLLANVPPDHPYLTDFGISTHGTSTATTRTDAGGMVGSVGYVAPEVILGERIDGRTDVYSLGCVTFELLTGRAPFRRDSDAATLGAHLHGPVPRVSEGFPDLPVALDPALERALAKLPEERWQRAGDLASALELAAGATPADVGPTRTMPARRSDERAPAETGRGSALVALAAVLAGLAAFFVCSQLGASGPAPAVAAAQREFGSAFWGVRFRYPAGWSQRALAPPGIGGVGDGDEFCNVFDDPSVQAPRGGAAMLAFGHDRARRLARAGGFQLRELELVRAGPVTGVDLVANDRAGGRPVGGHTVELFRPGGAVRLECSAPAGKFATADQRVFRPLISSIRLGRRAG
jgi:hypothetical protein